MNGAQLLSTLQQQLTGSGIIDVQALDDASYTTVFDQLGIAYVLHINGVNDANWTSTQENNQTEIVLDAVLTESSVILGLQQSTAIHFRFTPLGNSEDQFTLTAQITLPASWTFGTSFSLLNTPLFNTLRLMDPSSYPSFLTVSASSVVVSDPAQNPSLSFNGYIDQNSSVLTTLTWFVSGGIQNPVNGPIRYDASAGTVDMSLFLSTAQVNDVLGKPGVQGAVSLALYSGLNEQLGIYESGFLFDTTIAFSGHQLGLSALYGNTYLSTINLQIHGLDINLVTAAEDALGTLFGENTIIDSIPDALEASDLHIAGLIVQVNISSFEVQSVSVIVKALENTAWDIWPDVLSLSQISFNFTVFSPFNPAKTDYDFSFKAITQFGGTENGLPMLISANLPGLLLTGKLYGGTYNLLPLIEYLFEGDTKNLPEDLEIAELSFAANIPQEQYEFNLDITGQWSIPFGTNRNLMFEELKIAVKYEAGAITSNLLAQLRIKTSTFKVGLNLSSANQLFYGVWNDDEHPLDYVDIAIALGMYGLPDIPPNLDLNLTSACFELQTAGPSISFALTSASYGSAALIAGKDENSNWGFVFGMLAAAELSINLTDIDVVGNFVPSGMDTISVSNLRFVGATSAIPVYTSTAPLENVLGSQINSGLVLSIDLNIGTLFSETFSVRFGGLDDGTASDVPPTTITEGDGGSSSTQNNTNVQLDVTTPAVPAALPGPTSAWINVQRSFGPVHIARIGFRITEDNSLGILIDGKVNLAGLTIGLTGLEADVPVEAPFWPSFSLAGLEVGYISSGFTLAGALVKTYGVTPTQYTGELILQAGSFGATAFGSYTTVNNDPSLFAFLALNVPIGGPPFCVVTGLSFGFGYNRRLILPTIENVQTYPLVQAAMGVTDPQQTIAALDRYIVPQQNQYWLAAGIRFTSFEMLNAYALLTASFGTQIELALMGEALFTLPLAVPGEESLILAQADMVLLASINPSLGQLAVDAQLTSRSFVLDRNAQITGGFALYFWFGDNAHAGDFVVTLGGYNPYFNKPAYYPRVPLLGLNWQISSLISIKGGLYCALTPGVIMAGGNLSASFSSGNVKAWFNANADFLMRYKPFSFDATIAVSVGASYKLNLLFTTKTVSVTVGASLHLWGPPFAGKATVDLGVMSFDIAFGAAKRTVPPNIGWTEFRNSFLPPEPDVLPDVQQESSSYTQSLIRFSAAGGLLATLQPDQLGSDSYLLAEGETAWLVDPHHLRFIIDSPMPLNSFAFGGKYQPRTQWSELNGTLGIGPMGIAPGNALITFTVRPYYNGAVDQDTNWYVRFLNADYPAGLWHNTTNTMSGDTLVKNVLSGIEIVPKSERPDILAPLALSKLLFYAIPAPRTAVWSPVVPPSDDYFAQGMSAFQSQLNNQSAITTRADVLSVLAAQGLDVYQADEIDMAAYTANAPNLLYSAPRICYLGETSSTSVQTVSTWEY